MSRLFSISAIAPLLTTSLIACGDDNTWQSVDANPSFDADVGTPDALIADSERVLAVSGDFVETGILSTIVLPSQEVTQDVASGTVSSDPVIRVIGDEVYVINRFGHDNLTILNVDSLTLDEQISTGAGSNPQDVAVVGSKLFVAALGSTGVVVVDRANGNSLTTIDLSALDTNDNNPDCMSAFAVGNKVYVACGLLDGFDVVVPGKIVVIDGTTNAVLDNVALPDRNPVGWLQQSPADSVLEGDLVIGLVPNFGNALQGCMARIPLDTMSAPTCAIENDDLGGYAGRYEMAPGGALMWIVVNGYDGDFNPYGKLRALDLGSDTLWDGQVSAAAQVISDLTVCPSGNVVVSDQQAGGASGLRIYSAQTADEVTTAPLAIGLPPGFVNALRCVSL